MRISRRVALNTGVRYLPRHHDVTATGGDTVARSESHCSSDSENLKTLDLQPVPLSVSARAER